MLVQSVQKQKLTKPILSEGVNGSQLQSITQIKSQISQLQKQVTRIHNEIQRIRTASYNKN
jgi:hypothetical protein